MKERYQKVQKEHRFFNLEEGSEAFSSVRDGYGINIFKNGDRYIGFWEKNTMHGMGIYVFKGLEGTPVAYLGEFFYGKFHGLGKLVRMLDDQNAEMIYRGTWVQGRKGEQGVYFYDNPSTYYQGNWFNDQKHGEGRLVFPYGEFIGSWQANKREGPGRLRKASPSLTLVYEGNWQADELPEG